VKNHGIKEFNAFLREIESIGFRVERTKKGVYKMYPPKEIGGRIYMTHGTPKAITAIKKQFQKLYGIELKSI
jgi:hypothetical protein